LVSRNGRPKLERDILSIAGSKEVQVALQQHLIETGKDEPNAQRSAVQRAAGKGREALKQAFMEGVRILLDASCDCRLEVTHWMIGRLYEEATSADVVEWFFTEAENQVLEADEDEAKEVERVFGSR
jgi:hypothetical protein